MCLSRPLPVSVCMFVCLSGSLTHTITSPRKGEEEEAEKEGMQLLNGS